MLLLQRQQLRLHRTGDGERQALGERHASFAAARISFPSNSGLSAESAELLGVRRKPVPLLDARQHLEAWTTTTSSSSSLDVDGRVVRQARRSATPRRTAPRRRRSAPSGSLPMISSKLLCQRRRTRTKGSARPSLAQLAREIEDALDVVVVDVADHQQVDGQRLARRPARAPSGSPCSRGFRCGS